MVGQSTHCMDVRPGVIHSELMQIWVSLSVFCKFHVPLDRWEAEKDLIEDADLAFLMCTAVHNSNDKEILPQV